MKRSILSSFVLFGILLGIGCAAPPPASTGAEGKPLIPRARDADDFVVVDCLLPGQVRKLGRMTYLGPRRPVKATALECEIRGGEYVAYDRATLDASLKVWMPQAQGGDRIAQTYVGEIYLRGVGGEPRFDKAAQWFAKAAEQGYPRAQNNLGYLYENGLGVPKSPKQALNWYRKATGAEIRDLASAEAVATAEGGLDAGERRELESLRREVERRRAETESLRRQLRTTREEADQLRQELERRNSEIDAERGELEQARAELATRRRIMAGQGKAEVAALERELDQRESRLREQRDQLVRLQERIAGLEKSSEDYRSTRATLEALRGELDARGAEARSLQEQLDRARRAFDRQTRKSREALAAERAEMKRLEETLARRESQLEKREAEAETLQEKVARLDAEKEKYRRELAEARKAPPQRATAKAGPVIEVIDPKPVASRGIRVVPAAPSAKGRQIIGKVVTDNGIFSFTVNGKPEDVERNGMFKVWVPVKGPENTPVRMVAVDRDGKSSDLSFMISGSGDGRIEEDASRAGGGRLNFGRYHALVIGNNDYKHLPRLETAVNDAKTIADLLRDRYGFQVTLLLNADRFQIYTSLDKFRKELTEKENFLIYYAGHGELDKNNRRGYWLPVDATADSFVNAIPNYTITDILNNMSVKQAMVIADSCYSGILTRSIIVDQKAGMSDERRLQWLKTMAEGRSRTILSSGGVKPVLDTGGGDHSVFAEALIEILSSNDDVLEAGKLHKKVGVMVSYTSSSLGLQQVPQYAASIHAGHESGDFLFVPQTFRERFMAWR